MAASAVFAPRYAHAFAAVIDSVGLDAGAARAQLKDFAATLHESHDLREVLMDPSIPSDQKLSVLDALAERMGMTREARNFAAVIIDHQRLGAFDQIVAAYDQVANSNQGVAEAEVTTVHELSEDDRKDLEANIATLASSAVRVRYTLDPALLGGAIVKIGSTVYDGSLRGQFDRLKQTLVNV